MEHSVVENLEPVLFCCMVQIYVYKMKLMAQNRSNWIIYRHICRYPPLKDSDCICNSIRNLMGLNGYHILGYEAIPLDFTSSVGYMMRKIGPCY